MLIATIPLGLASLLLPPQSTERVSLSDGGLQGNGDSTFQEISANGRFVAFQSEAPNLVSGDSNGFADIFARDLVAGSTTRVSVDSSGNQANGSSGSPDISAEGRFITFLSAADNLVAIDINLGNDVFVHDTKTGVTELVSISSTGIQSNGTCYNPRISADGRYVSFTSTADNLVPGDTNNANDVFVFDRQTGIQTLVSKSSFGAFGNAHSTYSDLSADGQLITFASNATNLVPGDSNGFSDQFVHDLKSGITTRVSLSSGGAQGDYGVHNECAISANGQVVAFGSRATNLVSGDTNGRWDIFVHDRGSGQTERVSIHTLGTQANLDSHYPDLSADGRYVGFTSAATNLISGDTNAFDDTFLHDRQTGKTVRTSLDQFGDQIDSHGFYQAMSADARYVVFTCLSNNVVSGDTNGAMDVFLRDRVSAAPKNTMLLIGPRTASVGDVVQFQWFAAPASSSYWFAYSFNASGSIIAGHEFDLVAPTTLASGTNSTMGSGFFNSAPLPPASSGLTVYLEAAAMDGSGLLYDSYPRALTIF